VVREGLALGAVVHRVRDALRVDGGDDFLGGVQNDRARTLARRAQRLHALQRLS
jgi:hypothetical protein